jgi:hypothetical protein
MNESFQGLAKPTLAMLGGFSSVVVYRILLRFVSIVESLIRGEKRDLVDTQARELKAQISE